MNVNMDLIFSLLGLILTTIAQVMVWAYMIDAARGVRMIDYKDFRVNINICFLFGILVMCFMYLTRYDAAGELCMLFMLIHAAMWALTLIVSVVMMIVSAHNRGELKHAMTSSICKLLLSALAIWVVL